MKGVRLRTAGILFFLAPQAASPDSPLDPFLAAPDAQAALSLVPSILAASPDFDTTLARLRRGRTYSSDVPRGKLLQTHSIDGTPHHSMLLVPERYDPSRPWFVRFDLHGGMGQPEWKACDGSWSAGWAAIEDYDSDYITVCPAGWWDSMWWEGTQARHFRLLLDRLKRTYNVDENRVVLVGASDGGVAVWFYAFRDPDPWAGHAGFIGFPARLTARVMRADGQMHLSNLDDQRFFLVNAKNDRTVSSKVMNGYLDVFRERTDAILDYREQPGGHSMRLDQENEDDFAEFLYGVTRDPLPDRLSWATERTDRYNRRSWLVIDELDPDEEIDESNVLPRIYGHNVPRTPPPEPRPWGRVELEREGNRVTCRTRGVRRFRLLLSPDEFDLERRVQVEVDGKPAFDGLVEPDLETLLTWAARDDDRRMLFAAELALEVP